MTKKIAVFGAAVMTTVLMSVVLWQFRTIAIHLMISLMFAATLRPLSSRIVRLPIALRAAWIII